MSCFDLWDTFRFNHTYNGQFLYAYIPNVLYCDLRSYRDINYGDIWYREFLYRGSTRYMITKASDECLSKLY